MNLQFIEDRLKFMLVPGCLYYPHKIAKEGGRNEPELRILQNIVPRGCRAIDIGANRGYYSYALSKIAGVVEAFEPNPLMARFARRKLGRTVRIHEAALSNNRGMMTLHIPKKGLTSMHLNGSLKKPYDYQAYSEQSVRVLKLDDFSFDNVGFVKIDTDGSEMEVLEGGSKQFHNIDQISWWNWSRARMSIRALASNELHGNTVTRGGSLSEIA